MDVKKVIDFFGSQSKTAKALGLSRSTVWHWVKNGDIGNLKTQRKIQELTKGKIKVG